MDDRDAAYSCIGQSISIPASELPPLAQDEYFWTQLEGLEVIDTTGNSLGVVDYLFETGANDVLVIKCDGREILVPCVSDVVRRVDLERGVVELNWEVDD
jgi:16S rRNA processing protein RimM